MSVNITSSQDLVAQSKPVVTFPSAVPSSASTKYVNLQYYERVTFLIFVSNSTTVTGSAITLLQAKDVSGAGEKAQSFSEMFENLDTEAADALIAQSVTGDTFTTDSTANKSLLYGIEVKKSDLDTANAFNCIRVGLGDAIAATVTVLALLWPPVNSGVIPSSIVD